jgi:hypothetical protein
MNLFINRQNVENITHNTTTQFVKTKKDKLIDEKLAIEELS